MNLWIDGEVISVKRSTLCIHKHSHLAENFNDAAWVKKHTVTMEDGKKVVLMGYSSVMLSIINQLRLRSMNVDVDDLPAVDKKKVVSVENVVSKLFPGTEEYIVVSTGELDSQIIKSQSEIEQVGTWLEEVDRRSEPKLLYRASRDGWTTQSFHSLCDDYSHTLVVVKTSDGYVFGGYSDQKWGGRDKWKSSSSVFLFSLKCNAGLPPARMKVRSGQEAYAVYADASYGPCFGGGYDFLIGDGGSMEQGYTYLDNTFEMPPGASADETFLTGLGNEDYFDLADLEVFEV